MTHGPRPGVERLRWLDDGAIQIVKRTVQAAASAVQNSSIVFIGKSAITGESGT
jgi:hypothetical protein